MSIWIDSNNALHDDMDGAALSLPVWPQGLTMLTDAQVAALQAPKLADAQAAKVAQLQAAYQTAINTPVAFTNAAGVATTYPAGNTMSVNGNTANGNLNNVIAAGEKAWTMGKWLDSAGIAQTFTYADLQGLAAAMEAVQVLDWQDLVAKIAEAQAATTIAAVEAVAF